MRPSDDIETGTDDYVNALCDWVDEQWAMIRQWPQYNDSVDLDKENSFIMRVY